jgi:NodT family efflux transporter outer membrane factor (OMF) lipoprotein
MTNSQFFALFRRMVSIENFKLKIGHLPFFGNGVMPKCVSLATREVPTLSPRLRGESRREGFPQVNMLIPSFDCGTPLPNPLPAQRGEGTSTHQIPISNGLTLAGLLPVVVMLAFVSGCMVGPNHKPPTTETQPAWLGATNTATNAGTRLNDSPADLVKWWTKFQDPKLTELVQLALETNLDLKIAETRLREAIAVRGRDAGGLWPSLTATGSATRFGTVNNAPGTSRSSINAGAGALWHLDFFGATGRQIEADEASMTAANENIHDAQVSLASEVALFYIAVRSAQEEIAIAEENLVSERHTADLTRQKLAAGFVSQLDVANAEAQVASTASVIPSLRTVVQQNIFALSVLLNRLPTDLVEDLSKSAPIPLTPPEVPVGLPSDLLRRRPDIRAAEANLHAATAEIGVAVSQFYPQFSLGGNLNYQSSLLRDLFSGANGTYNLGPSVTWPIFSGGSTVSTVRLEKALKDESYLTYRKTVLTALQDVESELVAFANEWEHRQELGTEVQDNRRALDLSQQLYQQGTIDFLTVLDAERSLFGAQTSLLLSKAAISTDLVNIYRALGGGWEDKK